MSDYEASARLDRGLGARTEADAPARPGSRRGRQGRYGEPPGPAHRDAPSGQEGLTRTKLRRALGGVLEPARPGRPLSPEIKAGIDAGREAPLFASWEELLDNFVTRMTDALAPMRSGLVNKVLFSGSVTTAGAAGLFTAQLDRFTAPFGAVFVAAPTAGAVTFANSGGAGGAAGVSPPTTTVVAGGSIPGAYTVPLGRWLLVPMAGELVYFFSTVALTFPVVVLMNAPPPAAGIWA